MPFANSIARFIWIYILWFMRRPWVKNARRRIPNWLPESKRAAAWERIKAQDKWAMKHGRTILTVAVNILIGSWLINTVYFGLMTAQEAGLLQFRSSAQVR